MEFGETFHLILAAISDVDPATQGKITGYVGSRSEIVNLNEVGSGVIWFQRLELW